MVFRLFDHQAWRISNHLFYPDPLAAHYRLHHLNFYWMDGIFGMALSPEGQPYGDRLLYFHSMSGYREFYVKTSFLRKEGIEDGEGAFEVLGQSRGTLLLKWYTFCPSRSDSDDILKCTHPEPVQTFTNLKNRK